LAAAIVGTGFVVFKGIELLTGALPCRFEEQVFIERLRRFWFDLAVLACYFFKFCLRVCVNCMGYGTPIEAARSCGTTFNTEICRGFRLPPPNVRVSSFSQSGSTTAKFQKRRRRLLFWVVDGLPFRCYRRLTE
jgi:hypothetical protein